MRCAMEIIAERDAKIATEIVDLKERLFKDTIAVCEEVLSPHFEKTFGDTSEKITAAFMPKAYIHRAVKYGIKYYTYEYDARHIYWIDLELLTSYLEGYCYQTALVENDLRFTIKPKCEAN